MLDAVYREVVAEMERGFRVLERMVPPPRLVDGRMHYVERLFGQLVIQKMARQISGLHALYLLTVNGLHQEQGVIQRVLDDFGEDLLFLYFGQQHEWTERHERYVEDFWLRETDGSSDKRRGMVKRQFIRSFVAEHMPGGDPSSHSTNGRKLQKSYSGYVHGASENIIDMCVGRPPLFRTGPDRNHPFRADYFRDAFNYFYRALGSSQLSARLFGHEDLADQHYQFFKAFERKHEKTLGFSGIG